MTLQGEKWGVGKIGRRAREQDKSIPMKLYHENSKKIHLCAMHLKSFFIHINELVSLHQVDAHLIGSSRAFEWCAAERRDLLLHGHLQCLMLLCLLDNIPKVVLDKGEVMSALSWNHFTNVSDAVFVN